MKSQWRSTLALPALAGGLLLKGSLSAGDQKLKEAGAPPRRDTKDVEDRK